MLTTCCYFGTEEESEGQQSLNATHVAWENDATLPRRYAADGGRAGAFAPFRMPSEPLPKIHIDHLGT